MKLIKGYDWILIGLSLLFLLYTAANDLINLLSEKTTDIGISFSNGMILGLVLFTLSILTLVNKVTGNLGASVLSYSLLGYFLFLTCTGYEFHPLHNKYHALLLLGFAAYSFIFKAGTYSISIVMSIFWVYLIANFHEGSIKTLFDPSQDSLLLNPNCMLVMILCLTIVGAIEHYKRAETRKGNRIKQDRGNNIDNGDDFRTVFVDKHHYYNQGNHHHPHHHNHFETTSFEGTPNDGWDINFGAIDDD
ncbi:hypothetical protein C1N61_26550 (plasmid) [Priestia aryabhattai]